MINGEMQNDDDEQAEALDDDDKENRLSRASRRSRGDG